MFAALPRPAARHVAGILLGGLLAAWPGARDVVRAQAGCEAATVSSPRSGDLLRGPVEILGSASIESFNFYKVEWAALDDPQQWIAVSDVVERPVRNGRLDTWPTTIRSDGSYRLKLTLVDESFGERCSFIVEDLRLANASEPATLEPDERAAWPTAPATAPSAAETSAMATTTPDQAATQAPVASSTIEVQEIDEPTAPPAGPDPADEDEVEGTDTGTAQESAEASEVADGDPAAVPQATPAATARATLEPVVPKPSTSAALPPGMGRTFTAGLLLAVLAGLGLAVLLLRR